MAGEWLGDSWAFPKLERVVGKVGESSGENSEEQGKTTLNF